MLVFTNTHAEHSELSAAVCRYQVISAVVCRHQVMTAVVCRHQVMSAVVCRQGQQCLFRFRRHQSNTVDKQ